MRPFPFAMMVMRRQPVESDFEVEVFEKTIAVRPTCWRWHFAWQRRRWGG
jgi:hypothetical protein